MKKVIALFIVLGAFASSDNVSALGRGRGGQNYLRRVERSKQIRAQRESSQRQAEQKITQDRLDAKKAIRTEMETRRKVELEKLAAELHAQRELEIEAIAAPEETAATRSVSVEDKAKRKNVLKNAIKLILGLAAGAAVLGAGKQLHDTKGDSWKDTEDKFEWNRLNALEGLKSFF
jgi:hypothetical protein